MTETEIKVPFGREGYRAMLATGSVDGATGYLLGQVQKEMRNQGYGSEQFYRSVFEDALDIITERKVVAVVKFRREHKKVPKFLIFNVSVPRRE